MYMMYVDESGDPGMIGSPSQYFVLSGIVVHESRWRDFIEKLVEFRRTMRNVYGLPMRAEIHASEYIRKKAFDLEKHQRLAILRNFVDEIAKIDFISITNVVVDKNGKNENYDAFDKSWTVLFQRFENTLKFGNFPGNYKNDYGIIFTDVVGGKKLLRKVRKMARFNHIPNQQRFGEGSRNLPLTKIIEDPHEKDSAEALPIQACDTCAYFLMQSLNANKYIRKQGASNYFRRLLPVLNTKASNTDPLGIVRL